MKKTFAPFHRASGGRGVILWCFTLGFLYGVWTVIHQRNPIIPTPKDVWDAWGSLLQHDLLTRLWESYCLNLQALGLSTVISLSLAYLEVAPVFQPFVKILTKLRFLGFTGLTLVFGMYAEARALQVLMLTFGMSVFFLTSMVDVVRSVPQKNIDHARTVGMGGWETTWHVVVRGTLDQAFLVMIQSAAMGWVMLTMVEGLVRSQGGVGVVLIDMNQRGKLAEIFAIILSIMAMGMAQDFLLRQLMYIACPHITRKDH